MKKILIATLLVLLNCGLSHSQNQDFQKPFDLANSLSSLWIEGETEKAINVSAELVELYPFLLSSTVHNTLSQMVLSVSDERITNANAYLEGMYAMNNKPINDIIGPIYYWSKVVKAGDPKEIGKLVKEIEKNLGDSSNMWNMAERYGLLVLNELNEKDFSDDKVKKELLQKIMKNLEAFPDLAEVVKGKGEGRRKHEKRAWNRYLLAYSYNYLYVNYDAEEEYLKKAAVYSPDVTDSQFKHAYFYDMALLTQNTEKINFKATYAGYLQQNERMDEALDVLAEDAFINPSSNNLLGLKSFYSDLSRSESFGEYWLGYINSQSSDAPAVEIEFGESTVLNTKNMEGSWTLLEFWGTWCGPCVRELPSLEKYYQEIKSLPASKLSIYTLSYNSKDLGEFMNKNNYSFPVAEVGKEEVEAFNIQGFPTRILMTPAGKYLKLPYNADWKLYIKNYTQM
ncbi:TlpA disulfide reductase family protein [Flammeovirgaceae bacterium SG7u.111]|nr:TlpA disulfide reductase family protein [Flammeovirgaceae bacterium SG7u.132]WPO37815.1 TlpA disulfide reductase family protein [Flammeovirgaceae bacterium SG7u.111]